MRSTLTHLGNIGKGLPFRQKSPDPERTTKLYQKIIALVHELRNHFQEAITSTDDRKSYVSCSPVL